MIQNKKRRMFSAVCVCILLLILVWQGSVQFSNVSNTGRKEDNGKHYVAMITKSTSSAYWKSAFAGADAAGTEYNLSITMDGPENEEDYQAQNKLIGQAVTDGAEVIILSAVDYNANAKAVEEAVNQGVKIVVIDSDVNSNQVSCRISTDNYRAGQMAGEAVLDGSEKAVYVGIVNFDENSANGQQRENGFRDAVNNEHRITIVDAINVASNVADAKEGTRQMLRQHPQINVIVTFNEWTSLGVGYVVQEMNLAKDTRVIAFDSNAVSVGMLETGEVDALIVQNPYAMGYLGVECAYQLIYGYPLKETRIDTTTTLVTRENMFREEFQRVLFPFD